MGTGRARRAAVVVTAVVVTLGVVLGTAYGAGLLDRSGAPGAGRPAASADGDPDRPGAAGAVEVSVPSATGRPPEPTSGFVPVPPPQATLVVTPDAGGTGAPDAGRSESGTGEACDVGRAAGADQVVVVRSSGTRATVRACARGDDGSYVTELGPYRGYVGYSGVTGSKREGDGATPAGVHPLRGGFGTRPDPGLAQGWFVTGAADVWVDDPDSPHYNTHQRKPADGRWASAEDLVNPPAYDYAQVIGWNESATPGRGSAIFLHVSTGNPTAGCVSLPRSDLLEVMRWQRSGAVIAIS
ncbi:L,D-transpeptidase family protein [Thalassiella azotivora]